MKKVPKFVRSGGDPLAQLDFDTFFILTTFKTEILCVGGGSGIPSLILKKLDLCKEKEKCYQSTSSLLFTFHIRKTVMISVCV